MPSPWDKIIKIYRQDIAYLESVINMPRREYLLGLADRRIFIERLRKFLALLGHPEKGQNFLHITGTSGKGSTVTILQRFLTDSGAKVGIYTSPFATTSLEKIQINDCLISPLELHAILQKNIKPALDLYLTKYSTEPPSYFEIWLAMALLYFRQNHCDWVVLEAGLGGTHDATNVIVNPRVTAITNIGLDHTDILGNTKLKIAADKSGIIKKGTKFFTAEKSPELVKFFRKKCRQQKAEFVALKNLANRYPTGSYFNTIRQKENLNLALNILKRLKIKSPRAPQIIKNYRLICRQEIIQKNPLVILDGAHNEDKIANLMAFVRKQKYRRLHLIVGFAFSKNWAKPLRRLLAISDYVYLTHFLISERKAASLGRLYRISEKMASSKPKKIYSDPWQALTEAIKKADKKDLILITGSFFLAGELRKKWVSEEYILKNLKTQ